ncbi:MAG TPA: hypothetical protein VGO93_04470 [Candidatus Xenobia bacterium]|jgi:hypothetical protein
MAAAPLLGNPLALLGDPLAFLGGPTDLVEDIALMCQCLDDKVEVRPLLVPESLYLFFHGQRPPDG